MRPEFETFLARLYTDAPLRARFLADPRAEAERHQLTVEECDALERIDRVGLQMAARSFAHKRTIKAARRWWWRR
jgi:Aromatic-ring-opening dioxygenase LigAB, LigA subunit